MNRRYSELIEIPDFDGRFEYLKLGGRVGFPTFGNERYLNQLLYRDRGWHDVRRHVIIRDKGCDLAHPDFEIMGDKFYVHHLNPITVDDILSRNPKVFDPENLITTIFNTHQAIHYGTIDMIRYVPVERKPNDTCPWR